MVSSRDPKGRTTESQNCKKYRYKSEQAQLAKLLDVSRQTVNALETDKYDPSLPLAFKIAVLFECKIEDIFQPDGMEKK